uniref:Uncharacterized protein n=1 Tax=Xenopus tropicalis TaxID=8364 RepID=A0A803J2T6_XENTR
MVHQSGQVVTVSQPERDISGSTVPDGASEDISSRGKAAQDPEINQTTQNNSTPNNPNVHESIGTNGLHHGGSSICPVPPSTSSDDSVKALEQDITSSENNPAREYPEIAKLVLNTGTINTGKDLPEASVVNSNHRCQPHRMGGSLSGKSRTGSLDTGGSSTANKHIRTKSDTSSTLRMGTPSEKPSGANPVGQCHSSGIYKSTGRHKKQQGKPGSDPYPRVGRKNQHSTVSDPHSRSEQRRGRLSQQTSSGPGRVATTPGCVSVPDTEMGSTGNRSDGLQAKSESTQILCQVPRPPSRRSGRHDPPMAISTGIRISPSSNVTTRITEDSQRTGHSNPRCTTVAQEILVLKSSRTVIRTSNNAPSISSTSVPRPSISSQASSLHPNGMALEASVLRQKGFSEEVIMTMIKSRKPVTSKIYHRVWECY